MRNFKIIGKMDKTIESVGEIFEEFKKELKNLGFNIDAVLQEEEYNGGVDVEQKYNIKDLFDEEETQTEKKTLISENYEDFETKILPDDTIKIVKYKGESKDVVIPATINEMIVTEIGGYVFSSNELTKVNIPEGVTEIGYCAFKDNKLTSVKIPEGVTKIGDFAFKNNNLTSVKIPESVTKIGRDAFANNPLQA